MSQPTTAIYLNSQTPAAPSGNQNVKPQSDGATPMQSVTFYPQPATASLLGVVKPGSGLAVDGSGTLSVSFPLTFTFVLMSGATGTNVARRSLAPHAGTVSEVVVIVEASDPATPLTFSIQRAPSTNYASLADVFAADPSIAAGVAAGSVFHITNLTSSPLPVAKDDLFVLNVTSGSSTWNVTIYLRT